MYVYEAVEIERKKTPDVDKNKWCMNELHFTSNHNEKDFLFFSQASAKLQTMQKNRNWLLAALAAHGKKHSQGDTVRQVQPIHMLMITQMKRITAPGS